MGTDEEMTADIKSLTATAKRLNLKGKQITQYVREHMEKFGYEAVENITYQRKSGNGRQSSGGFLSGLLSSGDSSDED